MTQFRLVRKSPAFTLDVDFAVPPGITALYGPGGSGKSLVLQMAAGFGAPDSGRVLFEDAILYDAKANVHTPAAQRGFGYLPPAASLFPHLTLRENLRFAAQRFPRLDRHRRVNEWLDQFQLVEAAELLPRQLTGRQKLDGTLARILITEPKLLLLDHCDVGEPLLLRIQSLTKAPIVFGTRDLDLACAVASQILLLGEGRILQAGAPRDVLNKPVSIDAARLIGIANLFQGHFTALDPFRNTSTIALEHFSLSAAYVPAHFKGDRVWLAIRAEDVRVHAAAVGVNCVSVPLVRASFRRQSVRLEFTHGIFADLTLADYAALKESKEWFVEFPAGALQIL